MRDVLAGSARALALAVALLLTAAAPLVLLADREPEAARPAPRAHAERRHAERWNAAEARRSATAVEGRRRIEPASARAPRRATRAAVAPPAGRDAATVHGTLIAWAGAPFERVRVAFRAPAGSALEEPAALAAADASGRFSAGPIAPGLYAVELVPSDRSSGFDPASIRLAEVALVAGENAPLVLDVAAHLPGELRVRVTGIPPGSEAWVWAAAREAPRRRSGRHAVDAQGCATLPALPPGEHLVFAELSAPRTIALAREPRAILSASTSYLTFDVAPRAGRVLARDRDTGEPLAGVDVHFAPISPHLTRASHLTSTRATADEHGWVSVALAPGTYAVIAGDAAYPFTDRVAEIAWTSGGASPGAIHLAQVEWPPLCDID